MSSVSEVISLLYRADWTRLSLSAALNDGSSVLIAPGRRYREETPDVIRGCDGDRPWQQFRDDQGPLGGGGRTHLVGGPEPPLRMLLCPAWILTHSRLEVREQVRACGRDGILVVATETEHARYRNWPVPFRVGRTEAIVDAELGVLLRVARMADDKPPDVTELVSLDLDPVVDPAWFTAPPGSLTGESLGEALTAIGPIWPAWKTAAGLAAGGLGALIRYAPFSQGRSAADTEDPEAAMPPDDRIPELSQDGVPSGPEVGDDVLNLLQRGGSDDFAAVLHEWHDLDGMLAQVPEAARRTGFGGLGLLVSALRERAVRIHAVSALRIGGPGQYQIDHAHDSGRGPRTVACDGQRRWQVYADKVTVGPAKPLPAYIAGLADPSWLLECRLSGGASVMVGDRPAYRIDVARGDAPWSFLLTFPVAVAVVDAELGILLSLTSYAGGQPIQRWELRDIALQAGEFLADIPPGLRAEAEPDQWGDRRPPGPINIPLSAAGIVARVVGQEAANAARKLLRRLDVRPPPD